MCMSVFMDMCVYMEVYVCVHVCLGVRVCVCVCVCVCVDSALGRGSSQCKGPEVEYEDVCQQTNGA